MKKFIIHTHTLTYFVCFLMVIFYIFFINTNSLLQAQEEKEISNSVTNKNEKFELPVFADAENLPIQLITITKPKRTKVDYIKTIINIKEGDVFTRKLQKAIYFRLFESGLFYDIEIKPVIIHLSDQNSSAIALIDANLQAIELIITVTDKWTLLPIPFFIYNANGPGGGITLVEANLFGTGKVIVLHGFYSDVRFRLSSFYFDRHFLKSSTEITIGTWYVWFSTSDYVYGSASSLLLLNQNDNINNIVRKFNGFTASGLINAKYNFNDNFSLAFEGNYTHYLNDIYLNKNFKTYKQLPSSYALPLTLIFEYKLQKPFSEVLTQGLISSIAYQIAPIYSEGYFHSGTIDISYSIGLGKKELNLISAYIRGEYGNTPAIYITPLNGKTNRSISNNIRTNKFIALSVDHTIVVWRNENMAVISSYGGEIAYYEVTGYDQISDPVLNGGTFISAGLSIKQLAIPVVEFILGFNIPAQYMNIGIAIGGNF